MYAHWLINFKSLFSSVSECVLFVALEKRDFSPANIIHSEALLLLSHLYIYIRNNNGPKQISCGIPGEMFFLQDVCPLITTRFYRYFKKVWTTLANDNLYCMFAVSKLNHARLYQKFSKFLKMFLFVNWWSAIKTFVNLMDKNLKNGWYIWYFLVI